ncbi:hypothetical protein JIN84_06685 [Luteolibacter yonseiensis]|uniref:Type IV pilus biogenesis protein PilP n=1 Tax=Luteolibacter yonseiensis TaxID=1144680 RepID=A0A934R1M3_9BACT|nr:hypothetical protein [Luteolibacter yonseiensis]MBK1815291.1 hypothetical protein [Luteolibacter yonseiensis]
MGKLTHHAGQRNGIAVFSALAILCASTSPASAQPTPGSAPVPEEPSSGKTVPPITTPSRLVSPEEREAYIDTLASAFLIRNRTKDPFGQTQDPDAKPVIRPSVVRKSTQAAPVVLPLAEVVKLLVVTTIIPGEKRFLVGTRSFKQGDVMPVSFRNRQLRIQITEVTSRQISFRNVDSGETAVRPLNVLPAGMTPGHQGIRTPGMTPDAPGSPIEIEAEPTQP